MKKVLFCLLLFSCWQLSVQAGLRGKELSGHDFRTENGFDAGKLNVDPEITGLNYTNRESKGYTPEEPVIVTFTNNGTDPVASIDLYFQVNSSAEVVETYAPGVPLQSGVSATYQFKQKADLGLFGTSIVLKAGVRMAGDEDPDNNEIKVTLNNIATAVPFLPDFVYEEGGIIVVDPIGWKTTKKSGEAYWDITSSEWSVDLSQSTGNADCTLMTIPVWMTAGKTYDVKFDTYTDLTAVSPEQKNKMSLYVTTDNQAGSDMNLVWENHAIDQANAKYSFARFKPSKNCLYYFVFHCKSPRTAGLLRLQNICIREAFGTDAGVIAVTSPVDNAYQYTGKEKITVLIHNFGSTSLAAGRVKVNLQVDGKAPVTETVNTALEANTSLSYTFKADADLSKVGLIHRLSAWTTLAADQDLSDDSVTCNLESLLAGIPYTPDMGTSRTRSRETNRWSVADKNQDEFMFAPVSDVELDSYVFGHGGWRVGATTITVPKSDDELFSRPILLESGKQYKLSYLARIENSDSRVPLIVNLYKVTAGQRTLVKELWRGDVTSTAYLEKEHKVDIDAAGIYEFGFLVTYPEPLSFMIRLGHFRVTRVYDVNLTMENILIPTTSVSCYNSYPVGATVRNTGKNTISAFTLRANSSVTGQVEKRVTGVSLASGDNYTVYFDNNLTFNGTDNTYFRLSAQAEGDLYEPDNRDSVLITYVTPSSVPSMGNLLYAKPPGWTTINNNRDEPAFTFTQGKGFIYDTKGADVQAGDLLVSNCYSLKKDKIYTLEFNFSVNKGDTASFDTYLLNGNEQIPVVGVRGIPGAAGSKRTFKGYFAVPADGSYPVCIQLSDHTRSLIFNAKFNVSEAATKPDIQLLEITAPAKDTVYTKNETVRVTFKNAGKRDLNCVPFTCKAGDKVYHSMYLTTVSVNENSYTAEFTNVDLCTPGSYELEISAGVSQDETPENNVLKKTIHSLPVPDVAIVGLDSPGSGVLTKEEKIVVSIKNEGKGALKEIPVKCTVTAEGSEYKKELSGVIPGPVADGETVQYQFGETIDLYEEGRYIFNLWAELSGDVKEENNRKEVSVLSSHKEFDAGVTAITSPADNVLGEAETVCIQVKNYSQVDLYEVPVTAEITHKAGENPTPQRFSGKIAAIKAGETVAFTFDKKADMKAVGEYLMKAFTTVGNDAHPLNDVCEKTVKSYKTDVGVAEILSPGTGEEIGLCQISIRVKNYGESTVSRVPVAYKVGTMPQLGVVTETLAPGESCTYAFPAKYDFTAYKTYAVTAYTELEEDADASNNSCSKEIVNKPSGIDSTGQNEIALYPNPSNGSFSVSSGEAVLQSVVICNMEGVPLLRYEGTGTEVCRLDTPLANGNYLVKVVTSSGVFHLKLMVSK